MAPFAGEIDVINNPPESIYSAQGTLGFVVDNPDT